MFLEQVANLLCVLVVQSRLIQTRHRWLVVIVWDLDYSLSEPGF